MPGQPTIIPPILFPEFYVQRASQLLATEPREGPKGVTKDIVAINFETHRLCVRIVQATECSVQN